MSERTPESLWDRLMRKIDGARDEDSEVDESILSFHIMFIVPLFFLLIFALRR